MKTRVVLAFAPSLVGLFLLNCSDPDLCEEPQCAVATDGGGDGGGDATLGDGGKTDGAPLGDGGPGKDGTADGSDGTSPVSCNTAADVSSQPACVTDAYAVFVNGMTGSDVTGNGTKENAFKSIGKAIGASSSGGRVFICATTYDEKVVLSANVSLYGGFDCSSWAYSASNVPKVAPSMAGYALDLESVSGATIEDLEFDSIAGVNPGDSSIAVFAANSAQIALDRVTARAASAGGQPSQAATQSNYTSSPAPNGVTPAAGSMAGVDGPACPACLIKTSETSSGGMSGSQSGGGSAGLDGGPTIVGTPGGAGGADDGPSCASVAGIGANSPDAVGGTGAANYGTLSATGWVPAQGQGGSTADVAQGGGGGAGGSGGPGGSGACGGCGGGGGKGGSAGGSSFALLSYQSSVTLTSCTLVAGTPSPGGRGGDGQPGQTGGTGGDRLGNGCTGAGGGTGGNGGGGGGGAAGISVTIGYAGTKPTIGSDSMTSFVAVPAAGGGAGAHGSPVATAGESGSGAALLDLGSDGGAPH